MLGVDRSCLSRYESERLGAPPSVITYCLREVGRQLAGSALESSSVVEALAHAREVVAALERTRPAGAVDLPKQTLHP